MVQFHSKTENKISYPLKKKKKEINAWYQQKYLHDLCNVAKYETLIVLLHQTLSEENSCGSMFMYAIHLHPNTIFDNDW